MSIRKAGDDFILSCDICDNCERCDCEEEAVYLRKAQKRSRING